MGYPIKLIVESYNVKERRMKGVVYQNIKTSKKRESVLDMTNNTKDFFESGSNIGRNPLGIYFTSYIGHFLLNATLLYVAEDKAVQEGVLNTISRRQQELISLKGQIRAAKKIGAELKRITILEYRYHYLTELNIDDEVVRLKELLLKKDRR